LLDGPEDGDLEVLGWAGFVCDETRLCGGECHFLYKNSNN